MTDQQLRRHLNRIVPGLRNSEVDMLVSDQDFAPFLKQARHGEILTKVTYGRRARVIRFTTYNNAQKVYTLD